MMRGDGMDWERNRVNDKGQTDGMGENRNGKWVSKMGQHRVKEMYISNKDEKKRGRVNDEGQWDGLGKER